MKPQQAVAIASFMRNPTIRRLAASLEPSSTQIHEPAITLQARGSAKLEQLHHYGWYVLDLVKSSSSSASPVTSPNDYHTLYVLEGLMVSLDSRAFQDPYLAIMLKSNCL